MMDQPTSTEAHIGEDVIGVEPTVSVSVPEQATVTEGGTSATVALVPPSVAGSVVTATSQTLVCAYPFSSWECVTDTWRSEKTWGSYNNAGVQLS